MNFYFQEEEEEVALPVIPSRPKETWWLKNERSHPYKSKAYYILGPSEKLSAAEATPLLYLEKQGGGDSHQAPQKVLNPAQLHSQTWRCQSHLWKTSSL